MIKSVLKGFGMFVLFMAVFIPIFRSFVENGGLLCLSELPCGLTDTDNNLVALWNKCTLHQMGCNKCDIAYSWFPQPMGKFLFGANAFYFVQNFIKAHFTGDIDVANAKKRTGEGNCDFRYYFMDESINDTLANKQHIKQFVSIGTGFDDVFIRYADEEHVWVESDLPDVVEAKQCLIDTYTPEKKDLLSLEVLDLYEQWPSQTQGFDPSQPVHMIEANVFMYIKTERRLELIRDMFENLVCGSKITISAFCHYDSGLCPVPALNYKEVEEGDTYPGYDYITVDRKQMNFWFKFRVMSKASITDWADDCWFGEGTKEEQMEEKIVLGLWDFVKPC